MKINLEELNKDIEEGWINFQTHPTLSLKILKYSPKTAYSGEWTDLRKKARGLVIDSEGNIVANSIPKFHNHSEIQGLEILEKNKNLKYEITDKLDGSLIQVALWNDNLIITSSGSFTSPQALKAKSYLEYWKAGYTFQKGNTYILEIIYPENRIVLNYGEKESLNLLAIRNTETGEELEFGECYFQEVVEKVDKKIEDILLELGREDYINKEGYVVRFENGDRVKFKYKKYVELHKIVSNLSEKSIWESLSSDGNPELSLEGIPDEIFDWVKKTCMGFRNEFKEIEALILNAKNYVDKIETRKEKAVLILESYRYIRGPLFMAIDGKDYSKAIWKMMKPSSSVKFGRGENV